MAAVLGHCLRRYLSTGAAKYAQGVRVQGPSAVSGGHEGGYKLWKNLTLFVAVPAIGLCMANCYMKHMEHAKHPHREPFVAYDYLRIRNKRFPWGDGQKSLFHNPEVNALPGGYEDEH